MNAQHLESLFRQYENSLCLSCTIDYRLQREDLKQILRKIKAKPSTPLKWFTTWIFWIQKWLIFGLVRLNVKEKNILHSKCCIIKGHHEQSILKDLTPRLEFQLAR